MKRRFRESRFMDADKAEHCLELWWTGKFDTADIASFLQVDESVVCRTIQAARDLIRMKAEPA